MATNPAADSPRKTNPPPEPEPMNLRLKLALAIYFGLLGLLLLSGAIAVGWGGLTCGLPELRLAAIAALAGGLGAVVHGASSFIAYAGARQLYTCWGWWYVMRPVIGASLALIFYFAFRGGLLMLSTSSGVLQADSINVFGVGAIGGLVGMFSKEATDKLKEIAEAVFKKQERTDPLKQEGHGGSIGQREPRESENRDATSR